MHVFNNALLSEPADKLQLTYWLKVLSITWWDDYFAIFQKKEFS